MNFIYTLLNMGRWLNSFAAHPHCYQNDMGKRRTRNNGNQKRAAFYKRVAKRRSK
jgi:hypothetical protein